MTTTETTMTPYAAAKLVNAQLKDLGIEKVVPPQMIYTYVKKGYIKSHDVGGSKKVTNQQLADWFVGYVNKLQGRAAKQEPETTSSVWNFGDLAEEQELEDTEDEQA